MLILLWLLLAVSAAGPTDKHPKWVAHPDIQCSTRIVMVGTALLVRSKVTRADDYTLAYKSPFSKHPESAVGIFSSEVGIIGIVTEGLERNTFGLDISLASQNAKSVTVRTQLFNSTQLSKLTISMFSFVKDSFSYIAVGYVEHTNSTIWLTFSDQFIVWWRPP